MLASSNVPRVKRGFIKRVTVTQSSHRQTGASSFPLHLPSFTTKRHTDNTGPTPTTNGLKPHNPTTQHPSTPTPASPARVPPHGTPPPVGELTRTHVARTSSHSSFPLRWTREPHPNAAPNAKRCAERQTPRRLSGHATPTECRVSTTPPGSTTPPPGSTARPRLSPRDQG